jgi:hypothetical protein
VRSTTCCMLGFGGYTTHLVSLKFQYRCFGWSIL